MANTCGPIRGPIRGPVTCGPRRSGPRRRSAVAELHGAVQRLDPDAAVAVALFEAQGVAGAVFAHAVRFGPEAVVDLAVERLYFELCVEGTPELEAQVAVD